MTTTTSKPDRAEINRQNARKSTGPKTAAGKARSRFNALKHGLTARTAVLPGEDPERYQRHVDAWMQTLGPRNPVEDFLAQEAARLAWQIERADLAEAARLASHILNIPAEEQTRQADEVLVLGRRLFWDARGPIALYPHFPSPLPGPRTSGSGAAEDPDDPARLVNQLEATPAGCRWLLARWAELRELLDCGLTWQSPDKLEAIRLLGKQPLDAADDHEVATIFLASWALDPERGQREAFGEVVYELFGVEVGLFKRRLAGRQVEGRLPGDEASARDVLRALVWRA